MDGFLEMQTAEGNVAFVAADFLLRSFLDGAALFINADNHDCLFPAMADSLEFPEFIRPGKKILASLKEVSLKIRSQAIGENRDLELVRNFGELKYLLF